MEKIESKFKEIVEEIEDLEDLEEMVGGMGMNQPMDYEEPMEELDDFDRGFDQGYDAGYADALDDEYEDMEDDYSIDAGVYESVKEDSKNKLVEGKLEEKSDDEGAKSGIKAIIDTDWGGSNSEQGKASELIKGLSFNDSDLANKFMSDLNKLTDKMDLSKYGI